MKRKKKEGKQEGRKKYGKGKKKRKEKSLLFTVNSCGKIAKSISNVK